LNRERLPDLTLQYDTDTAKDIIRKCLAVGKTKLGELDGLGLLACYGLNTLSTKLAKNELEAADLAQSMAFPVVMKIVSQQILHKSDAGGVVVGIQNQEEAKEAFRRIVNGAKAYDPQAEIEGVLVQKMASQGEEVILGMNRYAMGPLLMFGLGGIFVELFKDVSFRLAPIVRDDARSMIQEIKGYKLFTGFRGRPKADIEIMEEYLIRLSNLVVNHPEIMELDINPLLVHAEGKGATVADCRIILKAPQ
jgi:acetyltransferase